MFGTYKTTNDTMKLHPGNKSIIFYKDKVSASQLDEHKRLQSDSQEISISGGKQLNIKLLAIIRIIKL